MHVHFAAPPLAGRQTRASAFPLLTPQTLPRSCTISGPPPPTVVVCGLKHRGARLACLGFVGATWNWRCCTLQHDARSVCALRAPPWRRAPPRLHCYDLHSCRRREPLSVSPVEQRRGTAGATHAFVSGRRRRPPGARARRCSLRRRATRFRGAAPCCGGAALRRRASGCSGAGGELRRRRLRSPCRPALLRSRAAVGA